MSETESEFTRRMCECLRQCNCRVIALVGREMQEAGLPDRFVAHRELPGGVWLEVKRGDRKATPKQVSVIRDLRARGCNAFVLRWLRDVQLLTLQDDRGRVLGTLNAKKLTGTPGERGYVVVQWLAEACREHPAGASGGTGQS